MHVFTEAVEDEVGWYRYSEEDTDEEWCSVKLKKMECNQRLLATVAIFYTTMC